MVYENLKFKTARIVEITSNHIGVVMDGHRHFNIGISNDQDEFTIKKNIIVHASDEDFGLNLLPFDKLEDVPYEIRSKLNVDIDLNELGKEILEKEEKLSRLTEINCYEAREELLPSYKELLDSLYEKDVNGNPEKYNELMERVKLTNELFPEELGKTISVQKYEEILNGL